MYLSLFVVATLIVEQVSGFQGFPIPTSIFGSKPHVDVEAGLHLPKTVVGNKLMLGNTIFLDSNLLPIHDSQIMKGLGISDLDSKIVLLKKLIDPTSHHLISQFDFCPLTGQRLSKVDQFKKLFTLVDCDSDHFKKMFHTLPFGSGATNAHKILELIGQGGFNHPSVVCDEEKKNLISLLHQFAPTAIPDVIQADLTVQKLAMLKKLVTLLSFVKPELFHLWGQGTECAFDTSKELLDVKEFEDKFKISVHVGHVVNKEEEVHVFFDKEKKLHIKTPICGKTIPLPSHIDMTKTESFLHEGILVINVPKIQHHHTMGEEVQSILGECKMLNALVGDCKHHVKVNYI